jgi:hypothetical protein
LPPPAIVISLAFRRNFTLISGSRPGIVLNYPH